MSSERYSDRYGVVGSLRAVDRQMAYLDPPVRYPERDGHYNTRIPTARQGTGARLSNGPRSRTSRSSHGSAPSSRAPLSTNSSHLTASSTYLDGQVRYVPGSTHNSDYRYSMESHHRSPNSTNGDTRPEQFRGTPYDERATPHNSPSKSTMRYGNRQERDGWRLSSTFRYARYTSSPSERFSITEGSINTVFHSPSRQQLGEASLSHRVLEEHNRTSRHRDGSQDRYDSQRIEDITEDSDNEYGPTNNGTSNRTAYSPGEEDPYYVEGDNDSPDEDEENRDQDESDGSSDEDDDDDDDFEDDDGNDDDDYYFEDDGDDDDYFEDDDDDDDY
ncbi:hypothetical protein F5Y19DRAFT_471435 [Xylariaceae sp. FL1651]|nr:hypothetical protein F5Y19DRAFT_471435 [Xylariaceae sp. FL1651]